MIVTYRKEQNKYVDSSGRIITVADYGKDFYKCEHDFNDTGRRGETQGPNGKHVSAAAYQCSKCLVFMVIELNNNRS